MEKSYTFVLGNAKHVDTAKWEHEIEVRPLVKEEEAQKEPNPTKSDDDATGTASHEETGENSDRRRKTSYLDDKKADSTVFP